MRDQSALHRAFLEFAGHAAGDLEIYGFTRDLASAAARVLPVDASGVMLRSGNRMRYAAATTSRLERVERVQEALQQGPCREAHDNRRVVVESDLARPGVRWPEFAGHAVAHGVRAVAAVPMSARDGVWGVLDIYRRSPGPFGDDELEAARALASVAVGYLVLATDRDQAQAAQRELAHAATHDALTGLPNRALLYDRLEHALLAGRRRGTAVAAIYLDLDGFKDVNDVHGHHVGDDLLVVAARRLEGVLREGDTVARVGGDEFVILCEGVSAGASDAEPGRPLTALLARLNAALSRPVRVGTLELPLGASLGIAVAGPGRDEPDTLLRAADAAMYEAKRAARKRRDPVVDLTTRRTRRVRRAAKEEGLPHLDSNQEPAG